ncbi:MAG: porin family protein [Burkholderiales bacterium]|nr:porin family protein [Burkholderiales bacterium]
MKQRASCIAALIAASAMQLVRAGDFDGAYVSVQAGDNTTRTTGAYSTNRKNTGAAGVEMGYNWEVSGKIVGVSAFYDYNGRANHNVSGGGTSKYGSDVYGVDMIAGLPVNKKLLAYVKLGDAQIKGKDDARSFSSNALHGGVGVSYAVGRQWTAGAEWTDARANHHGTRLNDDNFMITTAYHFGV